MIIFCSFIYWLPLNPVMRSLSRKNDEETHNVQVEEVEEKENNSGLIKYFPGNQKLENL